MTKQTIISILMRRDGLSYDEAKATVDEVQDLIFEAFVGSKNEYAMYEEVSDIIREELGLEPDYIEAFLN